MIHRGFVIAVEEANGEIGRPIGNEDNAVMLFENIELAKHVLDDMQPDCADKLHIYLVNISVGGKVG